MDDKESKAKILISGDGSKTKTLINAIVNGGYTSSNSRWDK